jgi:DNA polymerase-4
VIAAASYESRAYGIRSAMPTSRAVRLCPDLVIIRPEISRYRDESAKIFEIFREFTPLVQVVSIDEAYLDVSNHLDNWGSATAVAREIKRRIQAERNLTVSIGVGPNRLIAKIASDFDKPDGLTVISPKRVQGFIDPLAVRSLPGVGPATAARLEKIRVKTIRQLRAVKKDDLVAALGRHGLSLYEYSRGEDDRPVRVQRERKSLSSESTFPEDLESLEQMDTVLEKLSSGVARGLRKRELVACTISAKIRFADFTTVTRAQTLENPTSDESVISKVAMQLLRRTEAGRLNVRLLGVGASKLTPKSGEQLALFG